MLGEGVIRGKRGSFVTFFFALFILILIILIKRGILSSYIVYDVDNWVWPLIILFFTVVFAKLSSQVLHRYFAAATLNLKVIDRTRYALFAKLSTVLIWVVGIGAIIGMVPQLRAASVSIFAGAGVLAIIIGFATQKTFGNLASGVFIATFQPYRIGDRLQLLSEYGTVRDITLRHTVIETWDNRRLIIPNSKMDEEVINNYSIEDEKMLGTLDITISYDSDIDMARAIMIKEAMLHDNFLDNHTTKDLLDKDQPVIVRVMEAQDSGLQLRLYYWAKDQPTCFKMRCELLESIKKRFDREGIEIPFPYRTLVYKKDIERSEKKQRNKARTLRKKAQRAADDTLAKRKKRKANKSYK